MDQVGMRGWTVERVAETGSTNADLLATAHERPDRSVLVADHQTAGRGRLDRRWDAPPGANLLVSILFHRGGPDPGLHARRVALAAVEACRTTVGADAVLKWPNDLLLREGQGSEAKLAGILAERRGDGPVVVGLGLNVGWAPPGAARLGDDVAPGEVLDALLTAHDRLPDAIDGADGLHERTRAAMSTLGRAVRVELADGVLEGVATDLERDGRLVVLDRCGITHRLAVGDVVHLRTG